MVAVVVNFKDRASTRGEIHGKGVQRWVERGYRVGTKWVSSGYHRESGYQGGNEGLPRGYRGVTKGLSRGY